MTKKKEPVDETIIKLRIVTAKVLELLEKKHLDYGTTNLEVFGSFGILVRVFDKVNRLKNLMESDDPPLVNETIEDTWMDIAGYAIQAIRIHRKNS